MRSVCWLLMALTCLLASNSQAQDGSDFIKGDRLLTKQDSPLKTSPKTKDPIVVPAKSFLEVTSVKDKEVGVEWHDGKRLFRGTLNRDHAMQLSEAMLFLEKEVKKSATAANHNAMGELQYFLIEPEEAIRHFSEAITLAPDNSLYYLNRGFVQETQGETESAIADYTKAIELNPEMTRAYCYRSGLLEQAGKLDEALKDAETAVKLDAGDPRNLQVRGWLREVQQNYPAAVKDYEESVRVDPTYAVGYNALAWVLATCPDDKVRNGAKAVAAGTKACTLTGWRSIMEMDTLAAAYAEKGDFKNAIKWQQRVVEENDEAYGEQHKERLKLYESGKPYREMPK